MKPWTTIDQADSAEGLRLQLQERDGVYVIRAGGRELMTSATHDSEENLATVALKDLKRAAPLVLVGGLGLGYTLRAALDRLPPQGRVVVAEISEAVVRWNRGPLAHLARAPLDDPRASVAVMDIGRYLATSGVQHDAILLDVDNGFSDVFLEGNRALYEPAGLAAFRKALRPGGLFVIWAAGPDPRVLPLLRRAGFDAEALTVPARQGGARRHLLYVAKVSSGRVPASPRTPGRRSPGPSGHPRAPRRERRRR